MNYKNNNKNKFIILSAYLFFPVIGFAFAVNLGGLVDQFFDLFRLVLPILNGIAFLLFFWGLARFIVSSGNGDAKALAEGRQFMIWGIVGLFILVSFWGIIQFLSTQFGFGTASGFNFLPQ